MGSIPRKVYRGINVYRLENILTEYSEGLVIQDHLSKLCKQKDGADAIVALQHSPVFTSGKRGAEHDFLFEKNLLRLKGIDIVSIPRGGQTTFHGPGQLVAYPILNLQRLNMGARTYVEGLEDAMIIALGAYGINARGRLKNRTGVWVGDNKIGAVGVKISGGITTHGIALNVNTDLGFYRYIVPCGNKDSGVTSMEQLLGQPILLEHVADAVLDAFNRTFNFVPQRVQNSVNMNLLQAAV